jgi:hypothetical protein
MAALIVRLYRILPLLIVLAVLALLIYAVVSATHSSTKAKEVLIRVFTVVCAAITVFFGIFTLYALFESNTAVLELAGSCAAVGAIGLIVVIICKHNFIKHNPNYTWRKLFGASNTKNAEGVTGQATIIDDPKQTPQNEVARKANIIGQIARLLIQLFRK